MNTIRNEETSINPLIGAMEERNSASNEDPSSNVNAMTRKVTPLQVNII